MEHKSVSVYHGRDKAAAIERAKSIEGYVVLSRSANGAEWGYWSDSSGMTRNWETLVWPDGDENEIELAEQRLFGQE